MAQKLLDLMQYKLKYEEFKNIAFTENAVVCELSERFSIIIQRRSRSVQLFLRSGKRRLRIPFEIFEGICSSQISVTFLKHCIEENFCG